MLKAIVLIDRAIAQQAEIQRNDEGAAVKYAAVAMAGMLADGARGA